jgi:putative transposase
MADHVHMCISIPPKYSVANIVGFIKGKRKNFTGENFWARGYFVSTIGLDEDMVRKYIREQEQASRYFCES